MIAKIEKRITIVTLNSKCAASAEAQEGLLLKFGCRDGWLSISFHQSGWSALATARNRRTEGRDAPIILWLEPWLLVLSLKVFVEFLALAGALCVMMR